MTIAFFLTMPSVASWNGKWSGEGQLYAVTRRVNQAQVNRLNGRSFTYGFSDGWRAMVECRLVKRGEILKLRRNSKGFCGYDWMVDSIILRDCITSANG